MLFRSALPATEATVSADRTLDACQPADGDRAISPFASCLLPGRAAEAVNACPGAGTSLTNSVSGMVGTEQNGGLAAATPEPPADNRLGGDSGAAPFLPATSPGGAAAGCLRASIVPG